MRVLIAFLVLLSTLSTSAISQPTIEQTHAAVKAAGGVEKFIAEIVRQSSKTLPQATNRNVEVQSVSSNGRKLAYTTRLLNTEKKDVFDLQALKAGNINYLACGSPVLGALIREYDAEVIYFVAARGNEFLFQYALNRSTCAGK